MKYTRMVLFALLLVGFARAQSRWTRTYGGVWGDYGRFVQQTADSGYVVTGYTESYGAGYNDFYLAKTDGAGDTLWTRTYGDTGYQSAYSARQTTDGGYVMTGVTQAAAESLSNLRIVKTDASGTTVWVKTYGGPHTDDGRDIVQTTDGGFLIAGTTRSYGAGTYDLFLVRTTASGDSVWTRAIGGAGYEIGSSVARMSDGGYVIAGQTSDIGGYNSDVYLIRTDAAGDTIWTRRYGGTGTDEGLCVAQTSDGGFIITGLAHLPGPSDISVYLVRTDSAGDTLWTRTYGGPYHDVGNSVQQTSDGGFIVVATTYPRVADADAWLIKTDSSGDTLWTRRFGGAGIDGGHSVQQTLDGGYIVAGRTTSYGAGNDDVWLIKTDADGYAGMQESGGSGPKAAVNLGAVPNPFVSSTRIPGHETARFELYDVSGKTKGTYPGNRVGEGLPPAVYFLRSAGQHCRSLRVVKVK